MARELVLPEVFRPVLFGLPVNLGHGLLLSKDAQRIPVHEILLILFGVEALPALRWLRPPRSPGFLPLSDCIIPQPGAFVNTFFEFFSVFLLEHFCNRFVTGTPDSPLPSPGGASLSLCLYYSTFRAPCQGFFEKIFSHKSLLNF